MLRLKNIKKQNKLIEADFYPENSEECGHLVVDLSSEEVISCVDVDGYGISYSGHAAHRLVKMANDKDERTECVVMWY